MRALALLSLVACNMNGDFEWPACITPCGSAVYFRGSAPPPSCAEVARDEGLIMGALERHSGRSAERYRATMKNVVITVGEAGFFAHCDSGSISLGWYERGGWAHEAIHQVDNCNGFQGRDDPIDHHHFWSDDGSYAAIQAAAEGNL